MIYFDILTTICIGLLIGTEFAVSAFINPILQRFEAATRMKAISYFAKRLGTAMPFWYVLSFLLLVAEAVLHRHEDGSPLLIAAIALWSVVIVVTLIVLVPINNRMMRLDRDSAVEASLREHAKWEMLHRGRVAVLTASMICFLLAVLR